MEAEGNKMLTLKTRNKQTINVRASIYTYGVLLQLCNINCLFFLLEENIADFAQDQKHTPDKKKKSLGPARLLQG